MSDKKNRRDMSFQYLLDIIKSKEEGSEEELEAITVLHHEIFSFLMGSNPTTKRPQEEELPEYVEETNSFKMNLGVTVFGNAPNDLLLHLAMSLGGMVEADGDCTGSLSAPGLALSYSSLEFTEQEYYRTLSEAREHLQWGLYWATTPDGEEDGFVIARSEEEAAEFHEESEGYGEAYASSELLCLLPKEYQILLEDEDEDEDDESLTPPPERLNSLKEFGNTEKPVTSPQWPSLEVLQDCGAVVIRDSVPLRCSLNGREFTWCVSDASIHSIWDDQLEAKGMGRPNGTIKSSDENH